MAEGYIKLHRKICDNPLFKEKRKFSKFEAWIDIILSASHCDNEFMLGFEPIKLKRGEYITSEVKLAKKWSWHRETVRRFLELLADKEMLVKNSTTKYTRLTVVNYGIYQDNHTAKRTSRRQQDDSEPTQSINDKNDNNDNKKDLREITPNEKLNQALIDFKEMRIKKRSPMTDRAIELLLSNLNKMAGTDEEKIAILEQSITNSWTSVYPLKDQKGGQASGYNSNPKQDTAKPSKYQQFIRKSGKEVQ